MREIDALGGEMGKVADATFIQSRMLNRGKGPAVHSLRAQIDRRGYQAEMKHRLELEPNLDVRQAEIVSVELGEDGAVKSVSARNRSGLYLQGGDNLYGTYLKSRIIIGEFSQESGPDGVFPATEFSKNLEAIGVELRRFKTGTPPRINSRSIDYSVLEEQPGDDKITPFSFETDTELFNRVSCHITYTNQNTHKIILDNLDRSPLFGGDITGIGPDTARSIEDKIVRFKDKERHQLFVEPMGLNTEEVYLQGFSSSMPEDIQIQMVHSLPGFENAKIMRNAYAIEYDCADPASVISYFRIQKDKRAVRSGQFNGTSATKKRRLRGL